jgi:hypothetical protein
MVEIGSVRMQRLNEARSHLIRCGTLAALNEAAFARASIPPQRPPQKAVTSSATKNATPGRCLGDPINDKNPDLEHFLSGRLERGT